MMPNDDIPVHARLGKPNVEPEKEPMPALDWIEHFENAMGDGRHELMEKDVRKFTCRLSSRGMQRIMADYFQLRNFKSKGKSLPRHLWAFGQVKLRKI